MGARRQEIERLSAELAAARQRITALERELEKSVVRDRLTGLSTLAPFERHLDERSSARVATAGRWRSRSSTSTASAR